MQFIDLAAQYRALKPQMDARIQAVLDNAQFIMGAEVAQLEQELAGYAGLKHCVTCANGTDALQLLFMAYGAGARDAVFCPDVTFIATIEPACMLGATPVFCDIEPDTYNISAASLEKQIKAVLTEGKLRPKAVIAVDFLGNPCDFEAIEAICRKYNLILIEDAAQSFGASSRGKRCGSYGHSAITSFFPAKPLGCYGDGGAIFTNDDNIADVCESLRVHGKGPGGKYANVRIGVNSRLDTLQAAVLLTKLEALPQEMAARQTAASYYNEAFSGRYTTPYIPESSQSAYAQYALLAKDGADRGAALERLNAAGIPNMVYYPTPLHKLPVFASANSAETSPATSPADSPSDSPSDSPASSYGETFPVSTDYCDRTFSIPFHPYLTKEEQDRVIAALLGQVIE